ncbi:MAG TPA: thermonuclease family protein [Nitrososphaeraceae archaeon]|nr:thermonuclease family protein [Nitrososphaeraceae archaeon]
MVFLFSLLFPMSSQAQLFPMENDIQEGNDNTKDIKNNYPINIKDDNKEEEKEESEPTLPKPTLSDEIELAGKVNHVVDGDTLDINDIRIRLSLVDTPERGDPGFKEATQFAVKLCLGENAEVDMDDGQRRGSFGREIGVVYCDGENLNEQLMENNLGIIDRRFCEKSEFSDDKWVKPSC